MSKSSDLTNGERQWLLAISRGLLKRAAAERSIPFEVLDQLLERRLACWEAGFLSITSKGSSVVALLRSLQG
jgi:hypothetical protein